MDDRIRQAIVLATTLRKPETVEEKMRRIMARKARFEAAYAKREAHVAKHRHLPAKQHPEDVRDTVAAEGRNP